MRSRGSAPALVRRAYSDRLCAIRPPRNRVGPSARATQSLPDLRIIALFGALGAIVPLIILSLEQDVGHFFGIDHVLTALRVLVWPASVLARATLDPISTLETLATVILNVVMYPQDVSWGW